MASVLTSEMSTKVSSVLNNDVTEFGKQHMFDDSDETCWNSDQGKPQFVAFDLKRPVNLTEIRIMFQGGFVAQNCEFRVGKAGGGWETVSNFFPEDNNTMQVFPVSAEGVQKVQLRFPESSDFFGRVTIYHLDLIGTE